MRGRILAVAALLLIAGCLGTPATTDGTSQPTAQDTAATGQPTADDGPDAQSVPEGTATTAEDTSDDPASGPDRMEHDYGTEFLSVEEVDQSWNLTLSTNDTDAVRFETLSPERQTAFVEALSGEKTTYEYGNPFSYHDDTRPEYVHYEGTWYFVRVSVV